MMLYLVVNLGLAAVLLGMRVGLGIARLQTLTVSFRAQLLLSRALVCAMAATSVGVMWLVPYAGLTWSVGIANGASSSDSGIPLFASLLVAVALFKAAGAILAYRDLSAVLRSAVTLRRIGRVAIVTTERIDVPCSLRTLRSHWVILPSYLLADRDNLRFAVSHELQHHRHGDTSWAWVVQALTIVCWPNPIVHLWRRWHSAVQELACDEALRERPGFVVADYARCLLDVAERALDERHGFQLAPSMATQQVHGTQLRRRIEMLFAATGPRASRRLIATTIALAICLGVGTSGVAAGWTTPSREVVERVAELPAEVETPCEDSLALECR